jgi:hypothetical protein
MEGSNGDTTGEADQDLPCIELERGGRERENIPRYHEQNKENDRRECSCRSLLKRQQSENEIEEHLIVQRPAQLHKRLYDTGI